jgi:hypothetical protein
VSDNNGFTDFKMPDKSCMGVLTQFGAVQMQDKKWVGFMDSDRMEVVHLYNEEELGQMIDQLSIMKDLLAKKNRLHLVKDEP